MRAERRGIVSQPATVAALAHDGRGVARVDGKATFIAGALPGETVTYRLTRQRRGMDEAVLEQVLVASPERVAPACAHFGTCGGCALQHLAPDAQLRTREQGLLGDLRRIARTTPDEVLAPLRGPVWGYRRRARLGVHRARAEGQVRVGFRGQTSHAIVALDACPVLVPELGADLAGLARLIGSLSIPDRIPQLELASGDGVVVVVVRHLAPLSESDHAALRAYGAEHGLQFWTQADGPASAAPLAAGAGPLEYAVAGERIGFRPGDFVQVNAALNEALVARVLGLLGLRDSDRVLDLFAGLGNFTLPIARRAREVLGVEGDAGLVARARANAERNGLGNARFVQADLFAPDPQAEWQRADWDLVLLDPPRAGAREVLGGVARSRPRRIVYVSCHPGTLARDVGHLVHDHGYRLRAAGIADMFPHTAHVESLACLEAA